MRSSSKSRQEILLLIAGVFQRHGYHGTSLSMLTEATGLERASLYHYFPKGKLEMAQAVLARALTSLHNDVFACLERDEAAEQRLQHMLEAVQNFYQAGDLLCLATVFAIGGEDGAIKASLAQEFGQWATQLASALGAAGLPRSGAKALMALATLQGGLVLAYNLGRSEVFTACLDELRSSWGLTERG